MGELLVDEAVDEAAALEAALVVEALWAETSDDRRSKESTVKRVRRQVRKMVIAWWCNNTLQSSCSSDGPD
jgi:hypothetical protein